MKNSTERFGNRVTAYASYRPSYPAKLIIDVTGEKAGLTIADIGAGTGIFTGQLLSRGCTVYAVEPNGPMREACEAAYGEHHHFEAIDGTAEHSGLPDEAVDIVCCAQSFHWFATPEACEELIRIVRPGGMIWLIWNVREREANHFTRSYAKLLEKHCPEYRSVRHENVTPDALAGLFAGYSVKRIDYRNDQTLDWTALRGRLESSSYAPLPGEAGYQDLEREMRTLFEECSTDGTVDIPMHTEAYRIATT